MHNGVFTDLRTVILFYNKFNSRSEKRQINPETGETWRGARSCRQYFAGRTWKLAQL